MFVLLIPLEFLISQSFNEVKSEEYSLRNFVSTKVKAFAVGGTLILCLLPWSIPSMLFLETTSKEGMYISVTWIFSRIALSLTFVILVFTELRPKRVDLNHGN